MGKTTIRVHMYDYEKINAITQLSAVFIIGCEFKPDEKAEFRMKCELTLNEELKEAIMRLVSEKIQSKSKEIYVIESLILGSLRAYSLIVAPM